MRDVEATAKSLAEELVRLGVVETGGARGIAPFLAPSG